MLKYDKALILHLCKIDMKTPKSIIVNTGDQNPVYETIDRFFESVQKEVERIPKGPYFERRIRGMYRTSEVASEATPLDDCVHMLLYKDRVIAHVLEIRTEENYIHFSFFKNLNAKRK